MGIRNWGMRGNLCRNTRNASFGFHTCSSIAPFPLQHPFSLHSNRTLLTDMEICVCTCVQKATSKIQPHLTQTGSKIPKGAQLTTGLHLYLLSATAQFWLKYQTQAHRQGLCHSFSLFRNTSERL